jgi:DNA polymerase III subunit chi
MTRIDFYFNAPDKLGMAATLARKAYAKKNRLLVYTSDAAQLDAFDKLLWTVPATGFLPHCRVGAKAAADTPILLSNDARMDADAMPHHDVLMNLDHDCPANFSRFERLLEIVSRDDSDDRVRARARLKFYRDRGYEIVTTDIATLKTVAKETS